MNLISFLCDFCSKENKRKDTIYKRTNMHFCNRSCAASYNNTKYPKKEAKALNRKCKYCNSFVSLKSKNNTVSYVRRTCDSCLKDKKYCKFGLNNESILNLTIAELKKMHKTMHRPWTDRVRSFARSWFPSYGKKCEKCCYSKHVEVCHIKAITDFEETATLKELNAKENIMYLCPNCHWEFDNL